jgi:hypothetical protein
MNETIVLNQPSQIEMVGWLQLRHRLHLEIKTGLPFSNRGPGTLALLRHRGITTSRRKWTALCDLNRYIAMLGGPSDQQSLGIQRELARRGKPYALPAYPGTLESDGKT